MINMKMLCEFLPADRALSFLQFMNKVTLPAVRESSLAGFGCCHTLLAILLYRKSWSRINS